MDNNLALHQQLQEKNKQIVTLKALLNESNEDDPYDDDNAAPSYDLKFVFLVVSLFKYNYNY